jgi:hypothetical protein
MDLDFEKKNMDLDFLGLEKRATYYNYFPTF